MPTYGLPFIAGSNEVTFSGSEIVAQITIPMLSNDGINPAYTTTKAINVANLQTISVSTHRDKYPVRSFGRTNAKGFTRGPRTIAGSLIFVSLDRESLWEAQLAVREYYKQLQTSYTDKYGNSPILNLVPTLHVDELPPFDITITMVNENLMAATAKIIGVEIVDNGQVMGIDDLYIEQTMSYIAAEYYPIYPTAAASVVSPDNRIA